MGEPLGEDTIDAIRERFFRPVSVRPLLARELEVEESEHLRLTEEQGRLFRTLGLRRRVAISGGAGTGKTLLALHRARILADQDYRTLLLCYNRPLADHLAQVVGEHACLSVMTFHQLRESAIRTCKHETNRDLQQSAPELVLRYNNRGNSH